MAWYRQSATAQSNNSGATLTLPAAPVAGNTLVLVVAGWSNTPIPPSGFATVFSASDDSNQSIQVFSRTVVAGDPAAWSCGSVSDTHNYLLLEAPGAASLSWGHGRGFTTDPVAGSANPLVYQVTVFEADGSGWAVSGLNYSPDTTWPFLTTPSGYHPAFMTGSQPATTGPLTLTPDRSVGNPVWANVTLTLPTPPVVVPPPSPGKGATIETPGASGSGAWSAPGPLFYAVEVDAYRPAGGSGAPLPLPLAGTLPVAVLSTLPQTVESYDTVRASDLGYRTAPADGVTVYPPYLDTAFAIDRKLNLDPSQSAAAAAWGSLAFANAGGRYDALAATENSDGRGIRVFVGSKAYDPVRGYFTDPPRSALRTLFVGVAQNWFCSDQSLAVPIRDATYFIERNVQTALFGGGGGLDGGSDLAGLPKPRTRGTVRNITPVLVDAVNRVYQWNDGPVSALTNLYEGGALTITRQGDVADLYSGGTMLGYYRTCNAKGLFQLGSPPVHQITIDGTAAPTASMASNTVIELARGLLLDDVALPAALVDTGTFTAAAGVCPWAAGYYLGTTPIDGATLLGQIIGSAGAKVFPKRDGRLAVVVLRSAASTPSPAATFSRANAVSLIPTALGAPLDPPPWRFQWGYAHNYTVQTSDLGGMIADAQKAFIANADRFAVSRSNPMLTIYRKPSDPPQMPTMLAAAADAQTAADRQVAAWSARRRLYALTVPVALGIEREIGDVVRLVWPMDDLAGGRVGEIVGEQFRGGGATITFQVLV